MESKDTEKVEGHKNIKTGLIIAILAFGLADEVVIHVGGWHWLKPFPSQEVTDELHAVPPKGSSSSIWIGVVVFLF